MDRKLDAGGYQTGSGPESRKRGQTVAHELRSCQGQGRFIEDIIDALASPGYPSCVAMVTGKWFGNLHLERAPFPGEG